MLEKYLYRLAFIAVLSLPWGGNSSALIFDKGFSDNEEFPSPFSTSWLKMFPSSLHKPRFLDENIWAEEKEIAVKKKRKRVKKNHKVKDGEEEFEEEDVKPKKKTRKIVTIVYVEGKKNNLQNPMKNYCLLEYLNTSGGSSKTRRAIQKTLDANSESQRTNVTNYLKFQKKKGWLSVEQGDRQITSATITALGRIAMKAIKEVMDKKDGGSP